MSAPPPELGPSPRATHASRPNCLAAVLGPILVAQLFGAFTGPAAPVYFPGAPFLAGAFITLASAGLLMRALRAAPAVLESASVAASFAAGKG